MMFWLLRIALWVQTLLGLGRFAGMITAVRLWETHISLGVAITVLALLLLRPRPGAPGDRLRGLARLAPLVPLLLGLGLYFDLVGGLAVVVVHMLAGLATVGLIEVASRRRYARESRA